MSSLMGFKTWLVEQKCRQDLLNLIFNLIDKYQGRVVDAVSERTTEGEDSGGTPV